MTEILRRGNIGREVLALQTALRAEGFDPGKLDGRFGPATEAALVGFQLSQNLLPDGIAGPRTWTALRPGNPVQAHDVSEELTVDVVAAMFPFTPLAPIAKNLPIIIDAMRQASMTDKPLILMAIATIRAESEGFEPINERPSRFNTSPNGHPFDLYDYRADLGNLGRPDGERFKGRGFVQLTGRDNYVRFGDAIGMDKQLVNDPDQANKPEIAARLLAVFIASRADAIKRAILDDDLRRARRLVNGGHHGLDRFIEAYQIGDRLLDDPIWRRKFA